MNDKRSFHLFFLVILIDKQIYSFVGSYLHTNSSCIAESLLRLIRLHIRGYIILRTCLGEDEDPEVSVTLNTELCRSSPNNVVWRTPLADFLPNLAQ